VFFGAFAIVPRSALQGHDQNIIPDKMRAHTCGQYFGIGCICTKTAQIFGAVNACLGATGLECRTQIAQ
jgi:hypothetical protein